MRTSDFEFEYMNVADTSVPKQQWKRIKVFYVLLALFVLGMMYGSILLKDGSEEILFSLAKIQDTYLTEKSAHSVIYTFFNSVISSGSFFLGSFLLGFSAIGQPLSYGIIFLKGLGIGSSIGYLYLHYGFAGIGYSALLILPGAVVAVFALILSARESIRLSNLLFFSMVREGNPLSKSTCRLYLLKHVILFGFILVSALLDSILTLIFAGMFQFAQ